MPLPWSVTPKRDFFIVRRTLVVLLLIHSLRSPFVLGERDDPFSDLLHDLHTVEIVNRELADTPPLFYNFSLSGGYFTMPSARMNTTGTTAFGGSRAPPYNIYGLNIQPFSRIELSANYLVYTGITEPGFGSEGYGDDAERIGNIKLGILTKEEDLPGFPLISIGAQDFIGTKRFNAQYIVGTKTFLQNRMEVSLGWGHGRIKGFFGGLAWTPFHHRKHPLRDTTIQIEYDANDYKKHPHEHPMGRKVKTRINGGVSLLLAEYFQLSASSLRGEKISVSGGVRYPMGSSKGFFAKVKDPSSYRSPVDTEPLGVDRSRNDFAQELAYAFSDQGLDLYDVRLEILEGKERLRITVVNNRYRDHLVVKNRIRDLLAALTPSNIESTTVIVEATGLPCQSYRFRTEDLRKYVKGEIGAFEFDALSPVHDVSPAPGSYDSLCLFQRKRPIWAFTVQPRFIGFFGNTQGKFKCNLSATASPEGYLPGDCYYKLLASYSLFSNTKGMTGVDRLNPSHMFTVRSDSMKYFQTNSLRLEQAFLQRSVNLGKGFFFRGAGGYFETAYGGAATELLYYPAASSFAAGVQCATVWKRRYDGFRFFRKVRKFDGTKVDYLPFIGFQCFLDLYYDYKPLSVDMHITAGRFLAKDLGGRFEIGRYFKSGMRFSLWYSLTNANEELNGHRYHDKGFAFLIPLDMFLKQSSRNYVGYAMSAWLRDQAAQARTGKSLYSILSEERFYP